MPDLANTAYRIADQAKDLQHELELWDLSRRDDCRAQALVVALSLASSLESIIAVLSQPTDRGSLGHPQFSPVPGPRWRE